jgi:hypothetical protein
MRKMLHNYLDFAFGELLGSINKAFPAFWLNRPKRRVKMTKSQSSTTTSGSELRFDLPITPSSSVGGDVDRNAVSTKRMKRKQIEIDQMD